jgi:hypothetical protein
MKNLFLLILLVTSIAASAQTGKISANQPFPKAGVENTYTYTPPKGLLIPDKAQVAVIYAKEPFYKLKKYPLQKKGIVYEFSLSTPDSTRTFIARIVDENNKSVDNNNNQGYLITLYDKGNKKFPETNITYGLLKGMGNSYFNL